MPCPDHPASLALTLTLLTALSPDSEKSSRAASSLLANLWQYSKLHRDFRAVCSAEPRQQGHGVWAKCRAQVRGETQSYME